MVTKVLVLSDPSVTLRCKGKPLNWATAQPIEVDEDDIDILEADISLAKFGSFVISEKLLQDVFQKYERNCEFLPLIRDGKKYFAVNVITVIACLDRKSSTFNEYGGVTKAIFDISKIPAETLFKIKEDNFTTIFCTEDIHSAVVEANITGAEFEEYPTV
ncbi:hypothetical protein R50072_07980 [Simiduia litorea]|uniref:imm11 family protein n=1 Tax=Simiduia litorea TaxID=1435348 RepID=UPI0036F289AA